MCGRYALAAGTEELTERFAAVPEPTVEVSPAYNIAPTQRAPIVRIVPDGSGRPGRVLSLSRWGFLPHWAKDVRAGSRMINARVETIATSRAYASAFTSRRCLVPVSGWYEWRAGVPGPGRAGKQAFFVTAGDGRVLSLAGVWNVWRPGSADQLLTFGVVTAPAVGALTAIHDRMPLLLPRQRWDAWLAAELSEADLSQADLAGAAAYRAELEIRPVGPAVGDVRNDGPELIARVSRSDSAGSDVDHSDCRLF